MLECAFKAYTNLQRRNNENRQSTFHANSSALCLVLLTAISDDSEERRRQSALCGPGPHNRYLRNVAQNPSEEEEVEEEDRGMQNLGIARGLCPSWMLCL